MPIIQKKSIIPNVIPSELSKEDYMDWIPITIYELNHILNVRPYEYSKLRCINNSNNTDILDFEILKNSDSTIPKNLFDSTKYSWFRWGYTD